MATTIYTITCRLEFTTATARDNVFAKMKTALANAKVSDTWSNGMIRKDEQTVADSAQETV